MLILNCQPKMQGLTNGQTWTKAQEIWVLLTELEDDYVEKEELWRA